MNTRLKYFLILVSIMITGVYALQAQDEEPLSDEELKKYALIMDYADQEMERLKESYNAMIQAEELMAGGRRFVELKEAGDDQAKLEEIGATAEEIEAYNRIEEENNQSIAAFKEAYTEKIKDPEQLGAGLYNRINKELKSDQALNERYQAILEAVRAERLTEEGTETEEVSDSDQ